MVHKIIPIVLIAFSMQTLIACCKHDANDDNKNAITEKIDGVSFVGAGSPIDGTAVNPIVNINADWATVMPLAFTEQREPNLRFNLDWQWWGERQEGIIRTCELLNEKEIRIMVKPQIWMFDGGFTGDLDMNSEEDWTAFEERYETFILNYATIAENANADLFCIGTEMKNFVVTRPVFWTQLITKVKERFSGSLTYAGNWDAYKFVTFWDELDYIGIDAYFPLSDAKTPQVDEMIIGWQPWIDEIVNFQQTYNKKVIFTEFGFRSLDYCAQRPWSSGSATGVNLDAQKNAYEAFFKAVWDKDWFAGGFLWKWFDYHESAGGEDNNRFTPQNKPAEEVIQQWYQ